MSKAVLFWYRAMLRTLPMIPGYIILMSTFGADEGPGGIWNLLVFVVALTITSVLAVLSDFILRNAPND